MEKTGVSPRCDMVVFWPRHRVPWQGDIIFSSPDFSAFDTVSAAHALYYYNAKPYCIIIGAYAGGSPRLYTTSGRHEYWTKSVRQQHRFQWSAVERIFYYYYYNNNMRDCAVVANKKKKKKGRAGKDEFTLRFMRPLIKIQSDILSWYFFDEALVFLSVSLISRPHARGYVIADGGHRRVVMRSVRHAGA